MSKILYTPPSCSLQFLLSRPGCALGRPTRTHHFRPFGSKGPLQSWPHTIRRGLASSHPERPVMATHSKMLMFMKTNNLARCHHPLYLGANKCWPDVQIRWVWVMDPVLVDLYQSPDALQQLWLIKSLEDRDKCDTCPFNTPSLIPFIAPTHRQTSSHGRVGHAVHVEHRPEETQSLVVAAVQLQALKHLVIGTKTNKMTAICLAAITRLKGKYSPLVDSLSLKFESCLYAVV